MGFFMSDINFCNTKEQLNHLGEVVTGKVDGSPTGADIDTSTLPYTGQVRKTLPALEGEYDQSIADKEAEADAAIDSYRLLNKGPYAPGITLESKFEYITYNGESYFATNPPYTTTATTPDADGNLFAGGYTTLEAVANKIGNSNLLSNSNFLTPSPDAITHPNATPESYVAGTQIFSGVYAGDSGCTVTLIDGRVNCTAGDYKFKLPNTGGLERVPVFTSSVSDYDGIPKTTGVSHALVADEYAVTVTPAAGDVFSVKLEQGSVATRHEVCNKIKEWRESGDVRGWGASPSLADNTSAVLEAQSNGDVYFSEAGSYNFTQNITFTGNVTFKSGAKIKAGGGIGITLDCSLPNQHVLDQSSDGLFVFENKDKFSGNFLPVMFGLSEFRTNNDDSIIFSRSCSELNQIQEKYPPGTFNYETPIYYGGQLNSGNAESSPMIGAGRRITYLNKTSNKELTGVPNRFARSSAVIDNYNNIDAYIVIDHPNNGFRNFVEISGISFISSSPARVGYGIYSPRMALFNMEDLELRRCEVGYFTFDSFQGSINKLYGDNIGSKFIHFKNDGTGSGAGTSVHFDTCWVNGCKGTAFDIFGLSYSTMTNCAADNGVVSAADRVYLFNSCSGITMNGCGSENFSGQAATIYSASSTIVINGYRDLAHNVQGSLATCLVVDGGRVTLNSCTFGDYVSTPAAGTVRYEYEVFGGGKLISNNTAFPANFSQTATFASSSSGVLTFDGITTWRSQGASYSIGSSGPV